MIQTSMCTWAVKVEWESWRSMSPHPLRDVEDIKDLQDSHIHRPQKFISQVYRKITSKK